MPNWSASPDDPPHQRAVNEPEAVPPGYGCRVESLASALADRVVLLDGGLATRLEARGHDLSDRLWSARLLVEEPAEIRATHEDFFAAGAEVAITASYQVSESGFEAAGHTASEARTALRRSVRLAREAAEAFGEPRWVAASVGPYGASLADGSEYRGDYGLSVEQLRAWHRPRLEMLAEAGADVLACETIPSLAEAEALAAELAALGVPAWISLTAVGDRTRLGEPASEAYAIAAEVPDVVALLRGDDVQRLEVVLGVHPEAGPGLALVLLGDVRGVAREVPDVADGGFDLVVVAEIPGDGPGLGRRLHDDERTSHGSVQHTPRGGLVNHPSRVTLPGAALDGRSAVGPGVGCAPSGRGAAPVPAGRASARFRHPATTPSTREDDP